MLARVGAQGDRSHTRVVVLYRPKREAKTAAALQTDQLTPRIEYLEKHGLSLGLTGTLMWHETHLYKNTTIQQFKNLSNFTQAFLLSCNNHPM